jgi:hypothetical protein
MAFTGTESIRSNIVIGNMILEQVNTFTYLDCNISYREEKDTHSKITFFLQIPELLNNTLKPNLVQSSTILKLYKTLALPILLHGSGIWTLKQCVINRLRTAQMKYLRRIAGYSHLGHKRNEEIFRRTPCYIFRRKKNCTYTPNWF